MTISILQLKIDISKRKDNSVLEIWLENLTRLDYLLNTRHTKDNQL